MLFTELPELLQQKLFAKAQNKTIFFPEGEDARVKEACAILKTHLNIHCILGTSQFGIDHQKKTLSFLEERAAKKGKSLTAKIGELSTDPVFTGGVLLALKEVDAVVAGCVYTTAHVLRAALNTVGLKEGVSTLTSAFLFALKTPTKGGESLVLYSDCAVVPKPTSAELCSIAQCAQGAFLTWTNQAPHISFLSFSTAGSASHAEIDTVQKAFEQFCTQFPQAICDGEVQFDTACDPETAKKKHPLGRVSGRTNVFIFPDLNSGNIGYKMTQQIGGAKAWGPILLGTARPFADLSRGATALDVAHCAVLTAALGD